MAHPIRLGLPRAVERRELARLKDAGLVGLEVFHSDQPPGLQIYYGELAAELDLTPTGGSDFHGAIKPAFELGWGSDGNVRGPFSLLESLRRVAAHRLVSASLN